MSSKDELWKTIDRIHKKISGIYILRNCDIILYIGQSNDIFNKIKSHNQIPWNKCDYLIVESQEKKARMETLLIKTHNPPYNILKRKTLLPSQINSYQHSLFIGKNREERWKAEAEIINKYRNQISLISSREMQRLLWHEYNVVINHNTINRDLKTKKYTPYL